MVVPNNHMFPYSKWSFWGVLGISPFLGNTHVEIRLPSYKDPNLTQPVFHWMSQRASKVAPLRLSEGFGWFEKGRFKMWFQCPVMTGNSDYSPKKKDEDFTKEMYFLWMIYYPLKFCLGFMDVLNGPRTNNTILFFE